ncbi:MAG: bacterioferritin [Planctomycetota bacterium]|nr:MAG: bacterioferritin [Planctomycetota bacterium]
MMDRTKSIELLNQAVGDELQALHQYMYFHFLLDDMGLAKLAGLFKQTAIEEMQHVELLAERILFLRGDVELNSSGPVNKVQEPEAMLNMAVGMEKQSAIDYNQAAKVCGENADSATKQIFEGLVADEERHFDQYDTELENIRRYGASYLALQSMQGPSEAN